MLRTPPFVHTWTAAAKDRASQFQEDRGTRKPHRHRLCGTAVRPQPPLSVWQSWQQYTTTNPPPPPARLHLPWRESCNSEEPSHFQGISAGSRRWGGVCQSKALRHWCPEARTPRTASEPQLPHPGGIQDTGPVLVLPPSLLPAVSRDFLPPATNPLPCALPRDLGDDAGRHRRAGLASVSP